MYGLKKGLVVLISLIVLLSACLSFAVTDSQEEPSRKTDQILLKLKSLNAGQGSSYISANIANLNSRLGVKAMQSVFPAAHAAWQQTQSQISAFSQNQPVSDNLSRWFSISLSADENPEQLIQAYQDSGLVEYAEPVYLYGIATTPNDPYFNYEGSWGQVYADQWGLKAMQAEKAWNITIGSPEIIIAVIDTGVDYNHPDLQVNIWHNSKEISNNNVDDDDNGYADDNFGWDFTDDSNNPADTYGHGTHVAGIIAASGNNAQGISGVCWQAKIMCLKGLNNNGYGASDKLAQAIKYAVDNGARIINISWGGYGNSRLIKEALDYAFNRNCVIVAAAGNNNTDAGTFFPGNYSQAITVVACDSNGQKASFSNYGNIVDVAAPGVDILSLRAKGTDMYRKGANIIGDEYYRASGTSMATPFVSGLAALLISKNKDLSNIELEQIISKSCDDLGKAGKDSVFGSGRINAVQALSLGSGQQIKIADFTAVDTPSDNGQSVTLSWTINNDASVKGYSIYYAAKPFFSISDDGVQLFAGSPISDSQATNCVVNNLYEGTGYYFAVVASANTPGQKKSLVSAAESSYLSHPKPIYPVHNIIRSSEQDDSISWGADFQTKAIIPQNRENESKILNITVPAEDKTSAANMADAKLNTLIRTSSDEELATSTVEFKSNAALAGRVTIQLTYPESISGWEESNLRIYQLNENTADWQLVVGSQRIYHNERLVSVEVNGSELYSGKVYRLFSLAGSLQTLDEVSVFPNPYKPNSGMGHSKITFTNLIPSSTVEIYTLNGELVRILKDDSALGEVDWNAANEDGQKVASGIYVYLVYSSSSHKSGKLAVIK